MALIVALLATIAHADEKPLDFEARLHVDRGLAAYKAERYEEAIRELSAAYKIDPRREILYNWAQAERLSGDCAAAVPLYDEFLETEPPRDLAKQARKMIERCGGPRKARPGPGDARSASGPGARPESPEPDPEPEWEAPEPEPEPEPKEAKEAKEAPVWYQDTWGNALVGVGVVALGLGTTLFLISDQGFKDADANRATISYQDYDSQWNKARTTRNISIGCFVAGGALVAGGVARWVWVSVGESDGVVMVGGKF